MVLAIGEIVATLITGYERGTDINVNKFVWRFFLLQNCPVTRDSSRLLGNEVKLYSGVCWVYFVDSEIGDLELQLSYHKHPYVARALHAGFAPNLFAERSSTRASHRIR